MRDNYILATVHRDLNTDNPLRLSSIAQALLNISYTMPVVFPMHPRTRYSLSLSCNHESLTLLQTNPNIKIIDPVSYIDMIALESNSRIVVTDSGGVQKESYFFKKPCIILRPETEWIEIVKTGNSIIADSDYNLIMNAFHDLTTIKDIDFPNLFGNGNASQFICDTLVNCI